MEYDEKLFDESSGEATNDSETAENEEAAGNEESSEEKSNDEDGKKSIEEESDELLSDPFAHLPIDTSAFSDDDVLALPNGQKMTWKEANERLSAIEKKNDGNNGKKQQQNTSIPDENLVYLLQMKFDEIFEKCNEKNYLVTKDQVKAELAALDKMGRTPNIGMIQPIMEKLQKKNEAFMESKYQDFVKRKSQPDGSTAGESLSPGPPNSKENEIDINSEASIEKAFKKMLGHK